MSCYSTGGALAQLYLCTVAYQPAAEHNLQCCAALLLVALRTHTHSVMYRNPSTVEPAQQQSAPASPVRGLDALLPAPPKQSHDSAAIRVQKWYRQRQAEHKVDSHSNCTCMLFAWSADGCQGMQQQQGTFSYQCSHTCSQLACEGPSVAAGQLHNKMPRSCMHHFELICLFHNVLSLLHSSRLLIVST